MKRGDIVEIGPHRMMCGDSREKTDVAHLTRGLNVQVVFTSPPYADQRDYGFEVGSWTELMVQAMAEMPALLRAQLAVNIGVFYRDSQWVDYWSQWLRAMQEAGWLRIGWYIWDKLCGLPTVPKRGRLYPSHEFVFHLCKEKRTPNKTVACIGAGKTAKAGPMRRPNNEKYTRPQGEIKTLDKRIGDSVFRLTSRGNPTIGHPAVFPVGLPKPFVESFSDIGDVVYDPFCGSGTTLISCQDLGRVGCGMELNPDYCDLAVERIRKHLEK